MNAIGGRWKMSILCSLSNDGATRYNDIKRKMGSISNTML
ncbi:MAG: winged helix-turn-helix transcriptional regulator, partial [Oscillospiraceae bacterium]|nr:winged helix-turn-helix transcriptional regulator [Oscillospiraceae bacterium]